MADEFNEFDDLDSFDLQEDVQGNVTSASNDDVVDLLLKEQGINDASNINIVNEDGTVEKESWNNLSEEEKLSVLNPPQQRESDELDDDEVALINEMRKHNMTPKQYMEYVQRAGIDAYVKNNTLAPEPVYTVDDYTDDQLFASDFIARYGNVTDEEVAEALNNAKENPELYAKQIAALRKEYKDIEDENNAIAAEQQKTLALNNYNRYAQSVANEINRMSDFAGYDLNMSANDKQQLYEFVTGFDASGQNHFAKALADPRMLTRAAFFTLNGEQMIKDITNYFKNEITKVRKYYTDGNKGNRLKGSTVVFANKNKSLRSDDIDF